MTRSAAVFALAVFSAAPAGADVVTPEDILNTEYAASAVISPDGSRVAFIVSTPRDPDEKPGARYTELHVVDIRSGRSRPWVHGRVNVDDPQWSPDGSLIAFRMTRGEKAKRQVWAIPVDGGEARALTRSAENVIAFDWHPGGGHIAYTAVASRKAREKKLEKKGYGFTYVEENLRHRNLYMENVADDDNAVDTLTTDITVWSLEFGPDGRRIAAGVSEKNLIDYRYVFQHVYLIDVETKQTEKLTDNPGKLGNYAISPDGKRLAYTAALTREDHNVSQVFVQRLDGGEALNLTPESFAGHVEWCAWKDGDTVAWVASEGVWKTFSTVDAGGGERELRYHAKEAGVNLVSNPSFTNDFDAFAFAGTTPEAPSDVYYRKGKGEPRRLTTLNPWIAGRDLGAVEVYRHAARDGYDVQGLLHYPVDYDPAKSYPLVVQVHGGPESHRSWGWLSRYSRPIQVLCSEGYLVYVPNYRSSTGYGLEHVKWHLGDAAGVEFDDIADGIRALAADGLADPDRVGLGGGSYGGYAANWFATYYTDLVRAVVSFVGISDLVSKRSTTDIPYEELYVHSGRPLEEMWQKSLERSPIYYAHQSRTATLILGGADDTRVHPSQSLELYRRMKMNGHPAVRLVQYPGERHGNRKMPGRRDLLYRTVQWYNWYVRDAKPLDAGMPGVDISDLYPIDVGGRKDRKVEEPESTVP